MSSRVDDLFFAGVEHEKPRAGGDSVNQAVRPTSRLKTSAAPGTGTVRKTTFFVFQSMM